MLQETITMIENRRRFNKQEYNARVLKTRKAMSDKGIELLIVTDPSNINWLTGYDAWSFYVHQCVVIGTDNTLFWFGRIIDVAGAAMTTDLSAENIIEYPDSYVQSEQEHPMEYLAEILTKKGFNTCEIGLEKDNYYFSARAAETLYHGLPDAKFVDATSLVNWQRAVKSSQELIYMQRAGEIVAKIYERVMTVAHPGMGKNELIAEILHAGALGTAEHFGDYPAIVPLMGVGEESSACHLTWDGGTIPANSGVCMELAGVHARYHSPCSRTLYFGQPTQKYVDMEKMILESINITLDTFRPGNTCGEVADVFFNFLKKQGFDKANRVGYPIGLSYPPDWGERTMSLRRTDRTVLEEGMCFHFMPGIWLDDWGFEMTESVVVTPNGAQCLSNVPRKLLVIE
jgi:ectoine hydrolase